MTDAIYVIQRARVTQDPRVRTVGDKELVTVTVAVNPFGAKAKERYKTMFVDVTFAGKQGERAAQLAKGDVISTAGSLLVREYEGKNGKGVAHEIPYPTNLVILSQAEKTDAPADEPAPELPAADDPFGF